jgi:hypothetical protein
MSRSVVGDNALPMQHVSCVALILAATAEMGIIT